jgi:enterochelin esterase-like enzyme
MIRKTLIFSCFCLAPTAMAEDPSPALVLPEVAAPNLGPDSMVKEGVPRGALSSFVWDQSKVFPETTRNVSVYLPAGLDRSKPTAVMVFQDGHSYLNPKGDFRVPTVFDNLIHAGDLPQIIGIFIDPGHRGSSKPETPWRNNNRSFEYDTLSADYSRFLLEEILPEVGKSARLTDDPEQRAICGASSGGICAWTVAWQRPDAFRKVLSSIGSFTNIRGGDACPGMIRKTPPKPIRAFFQSGINDLDNEHGSWPLGNMQMQAALRFKKYDHRFVWGTGGHDGKHAGAILPDALRWLWRKEP